MNIKLLPILVFLWIIGGHALGQVSLLPQGNFEHPGVNTGWAEGFNIPNNQEFKVIAEGGKNWLRIENRDAGRQLDYVHAFVNVTPQIASLTVSVRMKATDLKIGKEGWHTARVALMFEGGSFDFPPEVPELRADSDWVTKSMERAAVWMRHYRNHPSVVMWVAGFNFFNSAVDTDPRHIGRRDWDQNNQRWQRILAAGKEMFDGLRQLDPTRIYYSHAGACTGDVYTMNCYLDLLPLQEREDWLSEWVKSGEMPVSMVEFGTPMDCTFRRGRHGFTSNITSEPLLTEYAAIYFGNDAYASEEPKYRQYLHDLFRSGMLYQSSENRLDEYANNHKIQQLYRTNTWRSWRTAGLPGGLRTWSWMQDALKEINGPTLAWIAGPAGAYTAKDHHFRTGQTIEKQIILLNDTRRPQEFTVAWTVVVGGKEIGGSTEHGSLAVSETRFIPIQVTASAAESDGKVDGRITLTATIGETTHQDTFAFRVFGDDRSGKGRIAVVDPNGMTGKMLADLGYTTGAWDAESSLVVIGRNALKQDPTVAAKLEAWVGAGGRAVICAQDPQWMAQALGWRVCPQVSRRVFPMNSPISDGMDADDLRDWTGSSTLIEAYPQYHGDYLRGNERDQPYVGWHWGNRGGVSSVAIEKPQRSGWRRLPLCLRILRRALMVNLTTYRGTTATTNIYILSDKSGLLLQISRMK